MHRSGTSAFTRVFSLLGADLPKNMLGPNPGNEAGHWESQDLIATHGDLLATAGSRWDDWREFNPDWIQSGVAEVFRKKLLGVLQKNFDGSPLFVVKDPRICRIVPLWLDVLNRFGAEVRVIIPVRNPLEVAASLKRRENFPLAKSYLLWLRHILDAEKATRQLPRAIVTYNDLLNDWRSLVGMVTTKTGIHWPRRSDRSELEIDQFLVDTLRHHAADSAQLAARADVADWVKEAYRLLHQMAGNREPKAQFKRLDRVHAEFDKACAAFGLVLASEAEQNETQLRSIETRIKTRDDEVVQLSEELTQARNAVNEAQGAATASHSQAALLATDLEAAHAAARDREIAVAEGERRIEEIGGQLAAIKTASEDLNRERDQLATALEEERAAAAHNNAQAASLGRELEVLRAALREHQAAATKLRADVDRIQSMSNDRKNEIDKLSHELTSKQATLSGELDSARAEIERENTDGQRVSDGFAVTRIRDLEERLEATSGEEHRLTDQLARMEAEVSRVEKSTADRAAALAEAKSKSQSEILALRDQLAYAEAALAKSKKEQSSPFWMKLLLPSQRFRHAEHQLMKSGLFDAEWYLREYRNVVKNGRSPAEHYLEEGYLRGYRPNPLFDTRWYLEHYDDVRRSGINPAIHYLSHGSFEGRDPGPDFQTNFYLLVYPDVRASGANPLAHYLRCGRTEGRLPRKPGPRS